MKKLLFKNPVHKIGKNLSVRRGVKWSFETKADIQGVGVRQITTAVLRFSDILPYDLKNEHDESCRTYNGLYAAMKEVYKGFDEREIVTLVRYTT